jgi:hypothetical protein
MSFSSKEQLFRLHVSILFIQEVLLCLKEFPVAIVCPGVVLEINLSEFLIISLFLMLHGFLLFSVLFLLGFCHSGECDLCSICTKISSVEKGLNCFLNKWYRTKISIRVQLHAFLVSDCTVKMGQ